MPILSRDAVSGWHECLFAVHKGGLLSGPFSHASSAPGISQHAWPSVIDSFALEALCRLRRRPTQTRNVIPSASSSTKVGSDSSLNTTPYFVSCPLHTARNCYTYRCRRRHFYSRLYGSISEFSASSAAQYGPPGLRVRVPVVSRVLSPGGNMRLRRQVLPAQRTLRSVTIHPR